jgi:serine phosphatase RsbU (regulator of sigma subunit)
MARKSIRKKLITNFLLVSMVPITLVLVILNLVEGKEIREDAFHKIEMFRDLEKNLILDYFSSYRREVEYFAAGYSSVQNMHRLIEAFHDTEFPALKDHESEALKAHYDSVVSRLSQQRQMHINSDYWFPKGATAQGLQYKYLIDSSSYHFHEFEELSAAIHSGTDFITRTFNLRDILVVEHRTGYVVFTQQHGLDFGLNLYNPRYEGTGMRRLIDSTRQLPPGSSILTDFTPYLTAEQHPRLFIAAPVYHEGQSLATIIFQIDNLEFEKNLTYQQWDNESLEPSRESYMVGPDRTMRSTSRFYFQDPEGFLQAMQPQLGDSVTARIRHAGTTILTLPVETEAVKRALRGITGTSVDRDYRDIKVLNSYTPISIKGVNWVLVSQVDYREAMASLRSFNILLLGMLVLVLVVVMFLAFWSSERFIRPVNVLMRGTEEVKKDNLDMVLEPVTDDELRTLTEMFNTMVSSIKTNREELKRLYYEVSEKKREITDSIEYALRIQQAALPARGAMQEVFADHFIMYLPKDIVSGDFYWYHQLDDRFILVAADCTGHGVPGSFISLLMIRFLRRAVMDDRMTEPDRILGRMRRELISFFEKEHPREDIRDGMDAVICSYQPESRKLDFAGAKNPLYVVRGGEVIIHNGDHQAVSAMPSSEDRPFTLQSLQLEKGDVFYIFSDGYPDQLGGPRRRKFMIKHFRSLLLEIHDRPMKEQHEILLEKWQHWTEASEQTDDILVIGCRP